MSATYLVPVDRGRVEVLDLGRGEPVLLLQTALAAHEVQTLVEVPALRDRCRLVHVTRRGYGGSSTDGQGIAGDAADARRVLETAVAAPAHVVGASYSAAVALTLAAAAPELVTTLTLLEPPPTSVPSAAEFRAACEGLVHTYETEGAAAALDEFMTAFDGRRWQERAERRCAGEVATLERDAPAFFGSDIPALLRWHVTPREAGAVTMPVLHIGGSCSGPWFAEVREWVSDLLPQTEGHVVTGAGHDLCATHPVEVAELLLDFVGRHPTA